MDADKAGAPPSRLFVFRYMTYEEIARALGSTPEQAKQLVSRNGWRLHADTMGRARASVPESYLHAWAAICASLTTGPAQRAAHEAHRQHA